MAKNHRTSKEIYSKNSYKECQKLGVILESKVLQKFGWFLTSKIDFESTILALFDEP